LLIGAAQNTYYTNKQTLTEDFIKILQEAIALDPTWVAQEIAYASDGRAINNSAPILALVFLSMGERVVAKQSFQKTFPVVVRTGSHFYECLNCGCSTSNPPALITMPCTNGLSAAGMICPRKFPPMPWPRFVDPNG
jgi:hypothetical protein